MENSFFIFTDKSPNNQSVKIERFHFCSWEFNNNSSLVEFGFEVNKDSIGTEDILSICLYIPWLSKNCIFKDLYPKLSNAENSRFIFNDYIGETKYLVDNTSNRGLIHKFSDRNELCILPINDFNSTIDKVLRVTVNLQAYKNFGSTEKPNIYFRFWIEPDIPHISMRKDGISKSTIIYDTKINERRNIPENKLDYFSDKEFCNIIRCFSFNIIPNKYDLVFFDNSSLKNVRTLEYESFNRYLGDKRVKKDELIVVFNKKESSGDNPSFSFFSIYSRERIGTGQFALAILINIICGILLFLPGFMRGFSPNLKYSQVPQNLPWEIYISLLLVFITLVYFIWPSLRSLKEKFASKK